MSNRRNTKSKSCFKYSSLEARELLAAASIGDVNGRATLIIEGTTQSDVVVVANEGSDQVSVTANGTEEVFNTSEFQRIRFLGGSWK